MARERRLFSEEFKREAVKLVNQPGATKAAIARDLGVGANLLGRWYSDVNGETPVSSGTSEKVSPQEYERMRRELAKVKTERDILKNRPTRSPVALMKRNSRRVHWAHAETVTERFLEA